MGDRAHCFVCNSYTSSILHAWQDGENCPTCGASQEDSLTMERVNKIKERLQKSNIEKSIADRNSELEIENSKLKVEVNLLEKDLWNFGQAIEDLSENFKIYVDRIASVKKYMETKK